MGKAYYGDQPAQDYDYTASKAAGQQKIADMFRRSQPMGPPPPTGVASYGVAPVDAGGSAGDFAGQMEKTMADRRSAMAGRAGGQQAYLGAGDAGTEPDAYGKQMTAIDAARGASDQQQQAADLPAPPPPAPASSIMPMDGGMGRERMMRQQMMQQRRPMGRGRGPATY
jgi:hypothetical protein